MTNIIRSRDGLPYDFADGLKLKGIKVDGIDGGTTIGIKADPDDVEATLLQVWIDHINNAIIDLINGANEALYAPNREITDDSTYIANTHFAQELVAAKIAELLGNAPADLSNIANLAAAINNDPDFYKTIMKLIGGMGSLDDVRGSLATFGYATGSDVNRIVATFTPAITELREGMMLKVRCNGANTLSAVTFTPAVGIPPLSVVKGSNQDLLAGDINGSGYIAYMQYDKVLNKWVIINPAIPPNQAYASAQEAIAGIVTNKVISPQVLKAVFDNFIGNAPTTLNSISKLAAAINNDADFYANLLLALNKKANKDSESLTGSPTAPTPAPDDVSDRIATMKAIHSVLAIAITQASTTNVGITRYANIDEHLAGDREDVAVTPKGMAAYVQQVVYSSLTPPNSPVLTGASSVVSGKTHTLNMSASVTQAGATINQFNITVDGGGSQQVPAINGSASFTWTATKPAGQSSTISVVAKDSNNKLSGTSVFVVNVITITVNTPSVVSPVSGATDVGLLPTFVTSAYGTTGGTDAHASSDWELRTAPGGAGQVVQSQTGSTTNLTQWTLTTALTTQTQYYLRVRHNSTNFGPSSWKEIAFKTAAANAPVFTSPVNNATGVPIGAAVSMAAFSPLVTGDIHQYTDWEVRTVSGGGGTLVAALYSNSTYKTNWQIPVEAMGYNTTYFLRARYNGSLSGPSAWSEISFTTGYVKDPTITFPTNGSIGVALLPTFAISDFASSGTDTHAATDWEVRTAPGGGGTAIVQSPNNTAALKQYAVTTALPASTTLYLRVRQKGQNFGPSNWVEVMFATGTATLPVFTSPTSNANGVAWSPTFETAAYSGSDTHASSDWELRTAPGGAGTLIANTVANTSSKTKWTPSGVTLTANTTYYVRVRFYGSSYGYSNWSEISFTTGYVSAPAWANPAAASINNPVAFTATLSSFSSVGNVTHLSTDFEIRTAAGGAGSSIVSVPGQSTNKTSFTITSAMGLAGNTTYYLRARFNTDTMSSTSWSEVSFTTGSIATPSITSPLAGSSGNSVTPTFTSSNFSASAAQTHVSSDWEVRTAANGLGTLIASSNGDTVNKTSWKTSVTLSNSTTYYVRVRHNSNGFGPSTWGEASFKTADILYGPNLSTPTYLGIGVNYTVTLSATPVSPATSIKSFTVTVGSLGSFTVTAANNAGTLVIPYTTTAGYPAGLADISATYTDNLGNVSRSTVNASIKIGKVIPAIFTSPTANATNIAAMPTLTTAGFSSSSGLDVHKYTDWEVRTASGGGGTLVWSSYGNTSALTSIAMNVSLQYSTTYYARARHVGTYWTGTETWSEVSFTTLGQSYIVAPVLSPSSVPTNASQYTGDYADDGYYTGPLTTQYLTFGNGGGTVANAIVEITDTTTGTVRTLTYPVATDRSVVGNASGNIYMSIYMYYAFSIAGIAVNMGRTYNVRVKWTGGSNTADSAWSNTMSWKTPVYPSPSILNTATTGVSPSTSWRAQLNRTYSFASNHFLEWQVATDSAFTNIVANPKKYITRTGAAITDNATGGGATWVNPEFIQFSGLSYSTNYYVRVRAVIWQGTAGADEDIPYNFPTLTPWSNGFAFTTSASIGINWSTQLPAMGGINTVVEGIGEYLFGGYSSAGVPTAGVIMSTYSTTAPFTMQKETLPEACGVVNRIISNGTYFVACTDTIAGSDNAGSIYYREVSKKASTWKKFSTFTGSSMYDVISAGTSGFIAVGTGLNTSTNQYNPKLNWINSSFEWGPAVIDPGFPFTGKTGTCKSIELGGTSGVFVACGENIDGTGWAMWSSSGVTGWNNITLPASCGGLMSVRWSTLLKLFVMVGLGAPNTTSSGIVFTSPDGLNWTKQSFSGGGLYDVDWAGNNWFAVGYTSSGVATAGAIYQSASGTYWVQRSTTAGRLKSITTVDAILVAGGYSSSGSPAAGAIATSVS